MKARAAWSLSAALCCLALAALAPQAEASRSLLSEAALGTTYCSNCGPPGEPVLPPPEGQIEDPCGLTISPTGRVYVADYYHRAVDIFEAPKASQQGAFVNQISLPGVNPVLGVNSLDSVCGLALDASGALYGNEWHQGVLRLTEGEVEVDSAESTGLAIDPTDNRLYVDDRTYVAEYELPFSAGDKPLRKIGLGNLEDGYGLAAAGGRVYVADAGSSSVKVFEPSASTSAPVATIAGHFTSLVDAALAIDPTNGHLLVVDNRQPGFEHPRSAVLEFDSAAGGYAFLSALPGAPIDGGPSGIAVAANGNVVVTDGNSELSNAFLYGPYESAGLFALSPPTALAESGGASAAGPATSGSGGADATAVRSRRGSAAASEVSQSGGVRVSFHGALTPRALPRRGSKPVVASVGAKLVPLGNRAPPQLRRIEIAINRNGKFAPATLPVCRVAEIQPATASGALAACRRSLVGEGQFSAKVLLPEQAPFPSSGKVYAFNGRWHGHPAILAHVYGTELLPVSYTIPFELIAQRGTYGTLLRASLPAVTGNVGFITGLSLTFGRGPKARGYVTAGCPAPAGISIAPFPFARVAFSFAGGRRVGTTLVRNCKAKG